MKWNKRYVLFGMLGALMMIIAACTPAAPLSGEGGESRSESGQSPAEVEVINDPVEESESEFTATEPEEANDPEPTATLPVPTATPSHTASGAAQTGECEDPFANVSVRFNRNFWDETNFCKHSVPLDSFLSGGPPPDGIPAIDNPQFESIEKADEWLGSDWPVMFFEWNGDARAYPLAILMWHEIVNDEVGGLPVTLTFCPLCNATIAFNRELPDGTVLDFGTSGNLRNSDLVMYDRQTQSWWQQFTGEAVVGDMTGTQLEFLTSQIISWEKFKENHPDGMVLSRSTGHNRSYGNNPYAGYDSINSSPFLYDGETDRRLPPMERVVAVDLEGQDVAYPFSELKESKVVNDQIGDTAIVVFWESGTVSALDAPSFDNARDVGSTGVFEREVDGQVLTFTPVEDGFKDEETSTLWNIFGEAVEGPLEGTQLDQIVSAEHFWFAWAAFKPETEVWSPSG